MKLVNDLRVFPIPYGTKEWYDFRMTGIGGSDIGVLAADNQETYKCQAQLFYEKLGLYNDGFTDNKYTFWGKKHEENIEYAWKFWDWKTNDFIKAEATGNIIRQCHKVNGFVVNPLYPMLYASIDRMMNHGVHDYMGTILPKGGILEFKTMSGFVKKKWETVPSPYLFQVHQYMMVHNKDYAEIVLLVDGRDFFVYPVERNEDICEDLEEKAHNFWFKKIDPCKVLVEELMLLRSKGDRLEEEEKILAEIARYEPDPENTKAYKGFVNQQYERKYEYAKGTEAYNEEVKSHLIIKQLEKIFKTHVLKAENKCRKMHESLQAERINLLEDGFDIGYTRMYVKANQKNPTFENRGNIDISETEAKKLITNLMDEVYESRAEGRIFLS